MVDRPRVIVSLPVPAESDAVADWLSTQGFQPVRRATPHAAVQEMQARAFNLLIADAGVAVQYGLHTEGRARNPLTPTILIGDSASVPGKAVAEQSMFLARPLDPAMLACFVSMAILDGRPTRRSARKPANRFEAIVNGVPSHIVDVSAEGLRLEVVRDRRGVLPPYFTVRVPLVGVAVTVQRMWTLASSHRASTMWYGGALSRNRASAEMGWRSFVDTIPVVENAPLRLSPAK